MGLGPLIHNYSYHEPLGSTFFWKRLMGDFIVFLPVRDAERASLGGKGANLSRLMERGLRVPEGFVVKAEAYRGHLARAGAAGQIEHALSATEEERPKLLEAVRDAVERTSLEAVFTRDFAHALEEFGAFPLAVRSSATSEDSSQRSFAGQFETVLGASGLESCTRALKRVWASAWTDRAVAYRLKHSSDAQAFAMAAVDPAVVISIPPVAPAFANCCM